MTADPSPHEKALAEIISDLEWRIKKWMQQEVGQRPPFTDQDARIMSDALKAIRSPYLTARVPDDVGEARDWLNVTASFLERGHWPTEAKAKETFISGLRETANFLERIGAESTLQSERIRGLEAEVQSLRSEPNNARAMG